MKWPLLLSLALFMGLSAPMAGQDFDIRGFLNQEGNAEAHAFADSLTSPGESVIDAVSNTSNQASVTGNDYVEGTLQHGIQVLGKGAIPELPIADAASAAGSYAGGDTQTAADTAVSGSMGAIAGWGVGGLVEGLAVDGVLVVGTVSAPAWIPAVVAGATAGMLVKGIYGWLLAPTSADGSPKPTPHPPEQTKPAPAGTAPPAQPAPPIKKPIFRNPSDRRDHGDHGSSGGHQG